MNSPKHAQGTSEALVYSERRGDVGLIVLNAPATHNAMSSQLVTQALQVLREDGMMQARALVVASAGPSFCAGANMADLPGWIDNNGASDSPVCLFRALAEDPRPVIAAVDGPAVGGGFELSLACDLVVASERAWFLLPELAHGVIPNTALMRLTQMVGMRQMFALMMLNERLDAQRAQTLGLVNALSAAGQAIDVAVEMASKIAAKVAPGALSLAKRLANDYAQTDWDLVQTSLAQAPREQWQEGLRAFDEKRAADYARFWEEQSRAQASGD